MISRRLAIFSTVFGFTGAAFRRDQCPQRYSQNLGVYLCHLHLTCGDFFETDPQQTGCLAL